MKSMQKKMKLCFLSGLAYPLFNKECKVVFGGAEVDLYYLARYFAGKDDQYTVTFVVSDYGQKLEEMYGNIRVRKMKYLDSSRYTSVRYKILRQLYMWKELMTLDADVFITEAASELLGWLGMTARKLRGKKVVFRLAHDHDTDPSSFKEVSEKMYRLYQYGVTHCDYIISQTDRQRKMLWENLGLESEVLKNGFFTQNDISYEDKKYILWVARAEDWKRPGLYLELARRLPEQEFVMIMPGNNSLKDEIKLQAGKLPNLLFIDYVPFGEVQEYYNRAKLFVNTSEHEGFPNAFVQACLGKTPILSFNVNPDDFINRNGLGFFCGNDMDRAAEFIRGLQGDRWEALGNKAFAYILENHDIEKIGKRYEEIVQAVLTEEKRALKASGGSAVHSEEGM